MAALAVFAAWAISGFCPILPPIDNSILNAACGKTDIVSILEPRLSSNARIIFPDSRDFPKAIDRWSWYSAPSVSAAVQVVTENDVAETIKYANANGYPFFAKACGHGAITSLGKIHNGIEIWLDKLDAHGVYPEKNYAIFGGGVSSKQVTDILWAFGKQTVIGGCQCTSLLGPGLGGGHGFLQGKYGLISDQFISMRVVLADGSIETVSAQSKPDLWWAMQGAGHNFGIVTSVALKIYDVDRDLDLWACERYVFTHDKVEDVYETINLLWSDETDMSIFSLFIRDPKIDPDNPVILVFTVKHGNSGIESSAFRDIGAISTMSMHGKLPDLPGWIGMELNSPPCQKKGLSIVRYPVNLRKSYNPWAQRFAFDLFAKITASIPQYNQSYILYENYPIQALKDVPADSTAFPHRDDDILAAPFIVYDSDPAHDMFADFFGKMLRDIIRVLDGSDELHAYVNYAAGNEGPKSWYGYEPWRLERLRELKKKYDPEKRFDFFAPFD